MTEISSAAFDASATALDDPGLSPADLIAMLAGRWKLLLAGPLVAGALALGYSYTLPPTFTATTTMLPPQQAQSSAASALASLGSLAGLAGGMGATRSPAEQYVALMESATVGKRIVEGLKLVEAYGQSKPSAALAMLAGSSNIGINKRDGLIAVQVSDSDPQRAADIANRYVVELRRMTGELALTESQRRRVFFERQLAQTRDRLAQAQRALQGSGLNAGALKSDPKAAVERYAKLQSEVAAAEVRLQALRGSLTDSANEVRQQQVTLAALQSQLARTERPVDASADADYVGRFREYKYQETLFELYARQFELARADESRDSELIQVVDPATPPELKSGPKRLRMAVTAALSVAAVLVVGVLLRGSFRRRRAAPAA